MIPPPLCYEEDSNSPVKGEKWKTCFMFMFGVMTLFAFIGFYALYLDGKECMKNETQCKAVEYTIKAFATNGDYVDLEWKSYWYLHEVGSSVKSFLRDGFSGLSDGKIVKCYKRHGRLALSCT